MATVRAEQELPAALGAPGPFVFLAIVDGTQTEYGALALTSACNAEHARVLIVEGTAIKPAAPAADGNLSTGGSGWVLRSGDVG